MEEKEFYYARLTVYMFSRNKIKMDYSCVPVTVSRCAFGEPIELKSSVSDEKFDIHRMKIDTYYLGEISFKNRVIAMIGELKESRKQGKVKTIAILAQSPDIEKGEAYLKDWLFEDFKKVFWWKRKYHRFLNLKRSMGQI